MAGECSGGTAIDRTCDPSVSRTCDAGRRCWPGYCGDDGYCREGDPNYCLDDVDCTLDYCVEATGECIHVPACSAATCDPDAGVACDDGSDCTDETCYPGFGCVYTAVDDLACVPRPDAGMPDAGAPDPARTHATWGCTASSARSGPAWLALALFVLVGATRRVRLLRW